MPLFKATIEVLVEAPDAHIANEITFELMNHAIHTHNGLKDWQFSLPGNGDRYNGDPFLEPTDGMEFDEYRESLHDEEPDEHEGEPPITLDEQHMQAWEEHRKLHQR